MMSILLLVAIIFVLAPIAQAYARRLNPPEVKGVSPREIARLREELDQLAAQVGRLQEEQSFMVRLLSEGEAARSGRLPPQSEAGPQDPGQERERPSPRP